MNHELSTLIIATPAHREDGRLEEVQRGDDRHVAGVRRAAGGEEAVGAEQRGERQQMFLRHRRVAKLRPPRGRIVSVINK